MHQGGTGRILEYFGEGVQNQSCTGTFSRTIHYILASYDGLGLATIANMGAEVGATTSIFPFTSGMRSYLQATGRRAVADAADVAASYGYLSADKGAEYTEVLEVVCIYVHLATGQYKGRMECSEFVGLGTDDQWSIYA